MVGKIVYLDSSAILKRYLREEGTELIDHLYREAERGNLTLCFSVWNIGEVIGVLDRYRTRNLLDDNQFEEALKLFYGETEKQVKLGSLIIEPVDHEVLSDSWSLLVKHHIYAADALQLSTAKKLEANYFISADKQLVTKAEEEAIKTISIDQKPTDLSTTL